MQKATTAPGIGELPKAVPALHGTFAGDAFVDIAYNPQTKVAGAALPMIMVTRFTRVADCIWDLTPAFTINHQLQLPMLPAAALSMGRQFVCVAEHLETTERICKTVDLFSEECQLYFDGYYILGVSACRRRRHHFLQGQFNTQHAHPTHARNTRDMMHAHLTKHQPLP